MALSLRRHQLDVQALLPKVSSLFAVVRRTVQVDLQRLIDENRKKVLALSAGLVASGGAVICSPALLPLVGFTASGIAKGSLAAGIQSSFYGGFVAKGSLFAAAQSAGATGTIFLSNPIFLTVGVVAVIIGGGLILVMTIQEYKARKKAAEESERKMIQPGDKEKEE